MTVAPRRIPEEYLKPTQTRPGGVGGGSGPPVASKDSQCRDVREDPILQRAAGDPEPPGRHRQGGAGSFFPSFPAASSEIPLEGSRLNVTQARPQATKSFKCDGEARTSAGPAIWARRGPASRVGRRDLTSQGRRRPAWPWSARTSKQGAAEYKQRPQKRSAQTPAPAPGTRAPASRSPRPRSHVGPPCARGAARCQCRPRPAQIPSAGLAGGAGSENKGAAPASFPAAASPAVPTALAGLAARTHRRIVRAALALPPAQNDERRRPARSRPAGHFRGHATSARAGRAADSACARSCRQRAAAILRTGLVGASVWAARQRRLVRLGLLCSLPQAFLSPGYPQESAGKLKGRGSEMVSLSATGNLSAAWYFCEVLGRACVTGASPSAGISPFEGPLPSRRGDEPAQPIPSSSRGQRVAAVRP